LAAIVKAYSTINGGFNTYSKKHLKSRFCLKKINNREFEKCIFKIVISNSFFEQHFVWPGFIDCNLSMTDLLGSSLKTVAFKNCVT
jgi:hypothetical protein